MGIHTMLMCGVLAAAASGGAERDFTCFQTASPYSPQIDVGSDVAIVYGVNESFAERVEGWRVQGYGISMMTGISWGGYDRYYGSGDAFRRDEVQTRKDGSLFMHGNSKTVGYNVPSDSYVDFIKEYINPAVDAEVQAIFFEEPEFWAESGWSEGFKREWQRFYGEPWQEPDSSPDAQYRASKLKYELYFEALRKVMAHVKRRASERGISVECHVPTHSLNSYAHWRIVSPESHLVDIPELDGYVAQVWTGTARSPNIYQGAFKERTFEGAFLEYGQMFSMVRPTGKKVWFLADPIEDNPNHSWNDYKKNYECTVVASLMWPEVHRFEVMPWPHRIFKGQYPKVDMDSASGDREGIPASYASEVLAVVNSLNDMEQTEVRYQTGSRGIGVVVSDTMMFQRFGVEPSDRDMGGLYGLALPLLKAGIPVEPVQLENVVQEGCLAPYRVLLLTYEHQKPLKAACHEALARWVREGGCLVYFGDGTDPYHGVREWWNEDGATEAKAYDDLIERLGVGEEVWTSAQAVEAGYARFVAQRPSKLQTTAEGAEEVRGQVGEMLRLLGEEMKTQSHLLVQRGPYVVASVLDETAGGPDLELEGTFVDLFEPELPIVKERRPAAGENLLLYDLGYLRDRAMGPKVVGASARIRDERLEDGRFSFVARGPLGTTAHMRVWLPGSPEAVETDPPIDASSAWDESSSTLWLRLENQARDVTVTCILEKKAI